LRDGDSPRRATGSSIGVSVVVKIPSNPSGWRFPSSTNPILPAVEIEAAKLQLPDRVFRQEMLAEFMDDAGGVFRNVSAAVDRGRTPEVQEKANVAEAQSWEDRRRYGGYNPVTYSMGLDGAGSCGRFNIISRSLKTATPSSELNRGDKTAIELFLEGVRFFWDPMLAQIA
jgi:hypothetical protein